MSKRTSSGSRSRKRPQAGRARRGDRHPPRQHPPAPLVARDPGRLLDRLLETPSIARIVPRLQPELLHRIIETCGLEQCGELVAMATPRQLERVFDIDLWHAARPGLDEHLDGDRFARWLEVLMDAGAAIAAQKIAGMDPELVSVALGQHIRVVERAALLSLEPSEGDEPVESRMAGDGVACEIGAYRLEARRDDAWDPIVGLLLALDADHPDAFHTLMRECRRLSNAGREV